VLGVAVLVVGDAIRRWQAWAGIAGILLVGLSLVVASIVDGVTTRRVVAGRVAAG
jgi:hypothetical protein